MVNDDEDDSDIEIDDGELYYLLFWVESFLKIILSIINRINI